MVSRAERRVIFHIFLARQYIRVIHHITPFPKGFRGRYITYGNPLEWDWSQSFGPAKASPHIFLSILWLGKFHSPQINDESFLINKSRLQSIYEGYGGNPSSDSRIRTTGLRNFFEICSTSVRFGHSQGLIQLDYASRRGVCLRDVCHRPLNQACLIGDACQTSKRMYLNEKRPARWRGACEKLDSDLQPTRVSADYPIEFFPCNFLDREPNGSLSRGLIFISFTSFLFSLEFSLTNNHYHITLKLEYFVGYDGRN